MVDFGTWVDPWTLLRCNALGRPPSLCPVAAPRFTGCRGYPHCGLALNWAGLAVFGSLAHGTGCSGARSLVLCCNGSGDTGATSFCHSWPHTSARVTGLQPLTLVSVHSHHTRHWSHHRINGVDGTAPRGPTNCQYGPVRLRPAVSRPFPALPPHSASSLVQSARACFPRCATHQSAHLSSGEPPATSWIFPVLHSYPAPVSISPSVDLRVHCVVHLVQDRFPCRSSCRLRLGKAAKGVAPVLSSETKCYAPAERCASPSTLGRERREQIESPKKRLHHQQTEQTKCPWLHCQDVGPLQQLEGPHSHDKCHRVSVHCPKPIPN